MTAREVLIARAETWLILARAFQAPGEDAFAAFRDHLAGDLEAAAAAAGCDLGRAPARLRAALARLPDAIALCRLHAGLFLAPPAPVHINAAIYLDGAPLGRSELALRLLYARHGLERAPGFHDLADHVGQQLEFVAVLLARAAEAGPAETAALQAEAQRFLGGFVARWLPRFRTDLERATAEHDLPEVYLALAEVLAACLDTAAPPEPA